MVLLHSLLLQQELSIYVIKTTLNLEVLESCKPEQCNNLLDLSTREFLERGVKKSVRNIA